MLPENFTDPFLIVGNGRVRVSDIRDDREWGNGENPDSAAPRTACPPRAGAFREIRCPRRVAGLGGSPDGGGLVARNLEIPLFSGRHTRKPL